jgi:hypothetical protein
MFYFFFFLQYYFTRSIIGNILIYVREIREQVYSHYRRRKKNNENTFQSFNCISFQEQGIEVMLVVSFIFFIVTNLFRYIIQRIIVQRSFMKTRLLFAVARVRMWFALVTIFAVNDKEQVVEPCFVDATDSPRRLHIIFN